MTALPEPITPNRIYPAGQPHPAPHLPLMPDVHAPAAPPGMRVIGYVRTLDGALLPQYGPEYAAPLPVRTPPAPAGLDPTAQRMAAGGILAAGVGAGSWLLFSALAGAATAIAALAALLLICKLPAAGQARGGDTYITNNRNSWWGRSTTNN